METKTKEVYYCEFCKKHGLSKYAIIRHESICLKNPENKRPCFECTHLIKKQATISGQYYNGCEWERQVEVLFCKKKNVYLHTPVNEFKGNMFDLGDDSNEAMPKECDDFSDSNEAIFEFI